MALVTIARLHDFALAQMVRMRFEAEDIPVHLGSEGFATLLGVQSRSAFADLMRTLGHEAGDPPG